MVVSTFSILKKDNKERFFEKSFLLADVKLEILLGILFLTINNVNIDFQAWNLQWRSYIIENVFPTTIQVELIRKKKFAVTALDPGYRAFVVHVTVLSVDLGDKMHPSKRVQLAYLKADGALTKYPSEYADFADVFSPKLVAELSEHTKINDHAIKLVDDQ